MFIFAQDGNLWEDLRKTVQDESTLMTITLNRNDKGRLLPWFNLVKNSKRTL